MAAVDRYAPSQSPPNVPTASQAPAVNAEAVTPSDTVDLTRVSRWLWIGGAGNMSVITVEGTTILLSGIPAGTLLPIRVSRVRATTTTATLIVSLD